MCSPFPRIVLRPVVTASLRAFTLIELLVVISIVAVLAGISLPVISNVKESGNSAKCISNLRQIGTALNLYANDNNNHYPPLVASDNSNWDQVAILPYLPGRNRDGQSYKVQNAVFLCPSARYTGVTLSNVSRTYSATECMVGTGSSWSTPASRNSFASQVGTLVLFDAVQSPTFPYCSEETTWQTLSGSADLQANGRTSTNIDYRHRNTFHGLYADGHVDTIVRTQAPTVVTKIAWTGKTQ